MMINTSTKYLRNPSMVVLLCIKLSNTNSLPLRGGEYLPQQPAPQVSVRSFLAVNLNVKLSLLEALYLFGSQIDRACDRSGRCFGNGQILERGSTHSGR